MLRKMDIKIKLLSALATIKLYFPSPPKKTMLKSGWIISDLDYTTSTRVGQGEGPKQYQIWGIGILWVRKCKFLTLFVQDGSYSLPKRQAVKLTFFAP